MSLWEMLALVAVVVSLGLLLKDYLERHRIDLGGAQRLRSSRNEFLEEPSDLQVYPWQEPIVARVIQGEGVRILDEESQ